MALNVESDFDEKKRTVMSFDKKYVNESIVNRFDKLIEEGNSQWEEFKKNEQGIVIDIISFTRWSTSCLNLLDRLSISSNRFVSQFEVWGIGGPGKKLNIGAMLGVLLAAKDEYLLGMAVDYHLAISTAVFNGFLDEAQYLLGKGYLRAAVVIIGASLEEGLKSRARSIPLIIGEKETLNPLIDKLKRPEVGMLNEFEAKQLKAVANMRNDAAHGGDFSYTKAQVEEVFKIVENTLHKILKS
jgi:hypothetical protein